MATPTADKLRIYFPSKHLIADGDARRGRRAKRLAKRDDDALRKTRVNDLRVLRQRLGCRGVHPT